MALVRPVSHYMSVSDNVGVEIDLRVLLNSIQGGRWRDKVEQGRAVLHGRGRDAYTSARRRTLPSFTPAGTFSPTRKKKNLQRPSGLVVLDFDSIIDVEEVRGQAAAIPHTYAVFVSPSGEGIKVLVEVGPTPQNNADYKSAWSTARDLYVHCMGVKVDTSGKDCSRMCFVSSDPRIYIATPPASPLPWHQRQDRREEDRDDPGCHSREVVVPAFLDHNALKRILPPNDYNRWLSWLVTLKAVGFTSKEVEEWSSQGRKYRCGEVLERWSGLPDDDPATARRRLRRSGSLQHDPPSQARFGSISSAKRRERTGRTDQQDQDIAAEIASGRSHRAVGRDYNIDGKTVSAIAKRLGVAPPKGVKMERARAVYVQTGSVKRAAEVAGVSLRTAQRWLSRNSGCSASGAGASPRGSTRAKRAGALPLEDGCSANGYPVVPQMAQAVKGGMNEC